MDIIITGRIMNGSALIGYRAWVMDKSELYYIMIDRKSIQEAFDKYNVINCVFDSQNNDVKSMIRIDIFDYPKYNDYGYMIGTNRYTDSVIIAMSLNVSIEQIRINVCGALVYGAITETLGKRAIAHAELYYEEVRHMKTDTEKIAQNAGYDIKDINRIKNYLFMESHELSTGFKRFDASFEIAQSWQRLIEGKDIKSHDITLLNHELLEMSMIAEGISQSMAHNYAQNMYNYAEEANEYYDKLREHNKSK